MVHTEKQMIEDYETYLKRQRKPSTNYYLNDALFKQKMANARLKESKKRMEIPDENKNTTLGLYGYYITHN